MQDEPASSPRRGGGPNAASPVPTAGPGRQVLAHDFIGDVRVSATDMLGPNKAHKAPPAREREGEAGRERGGGAGERGGAGGRGGEGGTVGPKGSKRSWGGVG